MLRPALGAVLSALLAAGLLVAGTAQGATPLAELYASPDITVVLSSSTALDEEGITDDLAGTVTAAPALSGLPDGADLVGFAAASSVFLFTFDTTVVVTGSPTLTVEPGDVLGVGISGSQALAFDASAEGIPNGVMVDAVGNDGTDLLLSFDIPVDIGSGVVAEDEDVVRWDGASLSLYLDASSHGVPAALDLDAVHLIATNGRLLVSFDGSGTLGGVSFDDEDVLELDANTSTWEMSYDGSAQHVGWSGGPDLDLVSVIADADGDGLHDGDETAAGTDPLDPDSDDDQLLDGDEIAAGTDPLDFDTDGDHFSDGYEVAAGTDPLNPASKPMIPVPGLGPLAQGVLVLLMMSLGAGAVLRQRLRED